MEWINSELYNGYYIIGDVDNSAVRLRLVHPGGERVLLIKHMSQVDLDNATLEDIRRHFAKHVHKVQAKTLDQIKLLCT